MIILLESSKPGIKFFYDLNPIIISLFHYHSYIRIFAIHDGLVPIVDTKSCFDDLLVGPDHVSRRPSDTYYATDKIVRFLINYKYLFMIILLIFHSTSISKVIIYLF